MNSIFKRRSIRKYKDKSISDELIEKILRAGMQAPSAINQQPWEFLVIKDKKSRDILAGMSAYSKMVSSSPVSFILFGRKDKMKAKDFWIQDLSACAENMLLEATELGLGSVWLGVGSMKHRVNYITREFNVPERLIPFCVVTVGYMEEGQENKFVDRYNQEVIHYEKF